MSTFHQRIQNINTAEIKCNICDLKFQTKGELREHLNTHISYKSCKKYAVNKCGTQSECQYNHVILPPGVHICYKCGVTSESKTDIIKHIKSSHGDEICHNFLLNKFAFDHCMFSHPMTSALNVDRTPEREMETPSAPPEEDFINLPTTGPVVRTEPRAEQEQETARPVLWSSLVAQGPKTVPNLSEEALNKIKKMTTLVIVVTDQRNAPPNSHKSSSSFEPHPSVGMSNKALKRQDISVVFNESSIVLTKPMENLLNHGLKFTILPLKLDITQTLVEFRRFERSTIWHEFWFQRDTQKNMKNQF